MLRRVLILGWLLYGALGPALSSIAAEVQQAHKDTAPGEPASSPASGRRSALQGVAELDKPVSYAEGKIPLGELVEKVAADTGVALTAHKDVADEPVTVYVKDLPARELLEQLADLLDYRWSRRTPAARSTSEGSRLQVRTDENDVQPANLQPATVFEIWQDLASKQREEALRQGVLADVVRRVREELASYVEVAALPEERIRGIAAASEQREFDPQHQPPGDRVLVPPSPEEKSQYRRGIAARRLQSPVTRSLASLLGRLTPQQWNAVSTNGSLTFSTDPQPGEERLTGETVRIFRAARPRVFIPAKPSPDLPPLDPEAEELLRQHERSIQEQWALATGFRVQIRLQVGAGFGGSVTLSASVTPLRRAAPGNAAPFRSNDTDLAIIALPASSASAGVQAMDEEMRKLARDPVFGTKKPFVPQAKGRLVSYGPVSAPAWRLFDLMPDMARVYGVQFIADAYWNGGMALPSSPASTDPIALCELLERFGLTRMIDRRGNLVRLRSRTWFFDRPEEIPLRLVRHWKAVCRERGALPLDEYLAMVTSLTNPQFKTVPRLVEEAGLARDLFQVPSARYALSLFAGLTPAQREALWQGAALPVARMSLAQQQLFIAALKQIDQEHQRSLNLAQWQGGALAVSLGDRTERFLAPRSVSRTPGVPDGGAKGRAARLPAAGRTAVAAVPPEPATGESRTRCPIVEVRFHLQFAPETVETVTLTVAPEP